MKIEIEIADRIYRDIELLSKTNNIDVQQCISELVVDRFMSLRYGDLNELLSDKGNYKLIDLVFDNEEERVDFIFEKDGEKVKQSILSKKAEIYINIKESEEKIIDVPEKVVEKPIETVVEKVETPIVEQQPIVIEEEKPKKKRTYTKKVKVEEVQEVKIEEKPTIQQVELPVVEETKIKKTRRTIKSK